MPLLTLHLVQGTQESLDMKAEVMSCLVYANMQLIPPLSLGQLLLEVKLTVYSLKFEEVAHHQLLVEGGGQSSSSYGMEALLTSLGG